MPDNLTVLVNTSNFDTNFFFIRYKQLSSKLLVNIDQFIATLQAKLPEFITLNQLDEIAGVTAASLSIIHPDYSLFGGRILMENLNLQMDTKNTTFAQNLKRIYSSVVNGVKSTRVSEEVMNFVLANEAKLQQILQSDEIFLYDYAAMVGFISRGLAKLNNKIAETPAQMFLRVAVGVNVYKPRNLRELDELSREMGFKPNTGFLSSLTNEEVLKNIEEYYNLLVGRKISLPGPILIHAGSELSQMASCFLEYCSDSLTEDSYHIDGKVGGIMKAVTQLAAQSKGGAGSAITLSSIRSSGSFIAKTAGKTKGVLPFMKIFDSTIGAIDQSGKRAGVCTVYLEPWHADILEFLDAADHFTVEEKKCKNLFFALIITDLFFERLTTDKQDAVWTLFDPIVSTQVLGVCLDSLYGDEWKEAYLKLEKMGLGTTIPLMEIWSRVCRLLQTTGMPYIVNKDELNKKSNSQNFGVIRSSNVCTEIALPSSEKETAVCVLTSICVGKYYNKNIEGEVDYEGIINAARISVKNLNNIIDIQFYPTPETRNACLTRRAVGVGSMGLADIFAQLKLTYGSEKSIEINKNIFECIYFGSLLGSLERAKQTGSYLGFVGSPASKGELQYDMWGISEEDLFLSKNWKSIRILSSQGQNPWLKLKADIAKFGLANSEVTAIAPTMSSSIRMEQNEMHEPFGRNIYIRQTVAGLIQIINKYLVKDLVEIGLWNESLAAEIIKNDGSIQGISQIPDEIKARYLTIYEVDWKIRIDMMKDRSCFVSQSSSFNHYVKFEDVGPTAFTLRIIYAWKSGLKTLSYYTHTETASNAKSGLGKFSLTKNEKQNLKPVDIIVGEIGEKPLINRENIEVVGVFCDPNDSTCEACQS